MISLSKMVIDNEIQGVVDMTQWLSACTGLSKSQVWVPASMSGGSKIPVPPNPRDPTSSVVTVVIYTYIHTHIHKHMYLCIF